jgi:ATP phosphoribosyltransferase
MMVLMMSDAVTAAIVGGMFALVLKAGDLIIESNKQQYAKKTVYEEQRQKFMEQVLDRLEDVTKERQEAEQEADEYKRRYWEALEERIKEIERRNGNHR